MGCVRSLGEDCWAGQRRLGSLPFGAPRPCRGRLPDSRQRCEFSRGTAHGGRRNDARNSVMISLRASESTCGLTHNEVGAGAFGRLARHPPGASTFSCARFLGLSEGATHLAQAQRPGRLWYNWAKAPTSRTPPHTSPKEHRAGRKTDHEGSTLTAVLGTAPFSRPGTRRTS